MAGLQYLGELGGQPQSALSSLLGGMGQGIQTGTNMYLKQLMDRPDLQLKKRELDIKEKSLKPYEEQMKIEREKLNVQQDSQVIDMMTNEMKLAMSGEEMASIMNRYAPLVDSTTFGKRFKDQQGMTFTDYMQKYSKQGTTTDMPSSTSSGGTTTSPIASALEGEKAKSTMDVMKWSPLQSTKQYQKKSYQGHTYEKREDGLWHLVMDNPA